jgi:hypothetical protein
MDNNLLVTLVLINTITNLVVVIALTLNIIYQNFFARLEVKVKQSRATKKISGIEITLWERPRKEVPNDGRVLLDIGD